jgi:hypothetical protein
MTKEALFKGENVSSLNFINVPMRTGVIIGSPQNSEKDLRGEKTQMEKIFGNFGLL